MNQYYETVGYDEDGPGIDLKDLFASILLRWKPILICLLICVLLGSLTAFLKAKTPVPFEVQLQNARTRLTEEQISDVESLYALYQGYEEYRRSLQDDYARYLSNASRASEYVLLNAGYYLTSSLEGLENVLPQTLLSEDDYRAMRMLCSEKEDLTSIYHRVKIVCSRSTSVKNSVISIAPEKRDYPVSYYVLVTLYGTTEEECTALLGVIDSAVKQAANTLQKTDPELLLQAAEKKYSHNTRDFINQRFTEHRNILSNVESQMLNLTNNRISKLPSAEKHYYNLLSAEQEGNVSQTGKQIPWKKWTAISAFLGLVLSIGICFLQYLFDGTIKTPEESEWLFRTQTLQCAFLSGKRNLFGKWASRLVGSDRIPVEKKTELLAADVYLMMEKAGYHRLYLLCDPNDENAFHFASQTKELINMRNPDLDVLLGNPFHSVTELELLSTSEAAIVFTEIQRSTCKMQTSWSELCTRYQLPVFGNVAVRICW